MFIAVAALSAFAIVLAMVRLAARCSGTVTARGYLMRYHPFSIGVGLCFSLGALIIFCVLLGKDGNREPVALGNGIVAFALVIFPAAWFTLQACQTTFLVFPRGILKLRRGRANRMLWTDIESISFDAFSACYRLAGKNGLSLAVSQFMTGQRQFAAFTLAKVPVAKLKCEKQLRKLL